MFNFKKLAENILADLMNNSSMSEILLKAKIFAYKRKDNELLSWVTKELEGYDEKPPKYRNIICCLKIDVFAYNNGLIRKDFPVEMIKDENIRNLLSNMVLYMPITEIEKLCEDANYNKILTKKVPINTYQFMSGYVNGKIQDAYQCITKAAASQVLVSVKSVLIEFLLKVDNEEDINFNNFIKTNPNMITINNANIVNTGSGDVNAQGSTNVVGDNNIISVSNKQDLLKILDEIDKIAGIHPNSDYEEVSKDIRVELKKDNPEKKYLKRCFQLIPQFLTGVVASVTADSITKLVSTALTLL